MRRASGSSKGEPSALGETAELVEDNARGCDRVAPRRAADQAKAPSSKAVGNPTRVRPILVLGSIGMGDAPDILDEHGRADRRRRRSLTRIVTKARPTPRVVTVVS
jgi:hypothetical protein